MQETGSNKVAVSQTTDTRRYDNAQIFSACNDSVVCAIRRFAWTRLQMHPLTPPATPKSTHRYFARDLHRRWPIVPAQDEDLVRILPGVQGALQPLSG